MRNNFKKLLFLLLLFPIKTYAQSPVLSLEDALQTALKNNFGIKTAQNDVQIAKNNAVKSNAGFSPIINLIATETPSFGYLNQQLSNGTEVSRTNLSNNLNAGVQLSMTLYDGKRMYLELDRLKELQTLGEVNYRLRAEQLVFDVMRTYYNILRQQDLYKGLAEQIDLYEERFRLAQIRLEVGKGNQLDVLQAQADLNVQKTQLLRQKQAIQIAKLQLNQLMTNADNFNFEVKDSLQVGKIYNLEELKNQAKNQNLNVVQLQKLVGISMLNAKEFATLLKPRLTLNSGFTVGRQDNSAGLFLVNQNGGLNAGVTLNYPIYDGGNIRRQIGNAQIEIESNKLRIQQLQADLVNSLVISFQNYQNSLEILRGEEDNMQIAKQSIVIAMERFRLSRSTVLELKQIQQTYETAVVRAVSAKADAKNAEVEMLRLSGGLLRNN